MTMGRKGASLYSSCFLALLLSVTSALAHKITGTAVQYAEKKGAKLDDLTLDEFRSFSPTIGEDVFDYIRIEGSVDHRQSIGGTARQRVTQQIKKAKKELS